jgi:hypothetical protein
MTLASSARFFASVFSASVGSGVARAAADLIVKRAIDGVPSASVPWNVHC